MRCSAWRWRLGMLLLVSEGWKRSIISSWVCLSTKSLSHLEKATLGVSAIAAMRIKRVTHSSEMRLFMIVSFPLDAASTICFSIDFPIFAERFCSPYIQLRCISAPTACIDEPGVAWPASQEALSSVRSPSAPSSYLQPPSLRLCRSEP